jgi:hypothetical protein
MGSATEDGWTGTGERREIAVLMPQGCQVPGSADQDLKIAVVERRKAFPWPLVFAFGDHAAALTKIRRAFRRSTSLLFPEGGYLKPQLT